VYPGLLLARLPLPQQITWQSITTAYRHWRHEAARRKRRVQARLDVLASLTAAYRQYHIAAGGYFVPRHLSRAHAQRLLRPHNGFVRSRFSGWEHDLKRSRHLLSVADLAALWHLPQAQDLADLSYVERGRARTFLVPAVLTTGNGWRIGESAHAGQRAPVYVPGECLRHNLLSIASTGKGKSTLFQHLAQATLSPGNADGLVVIEPHGDLIATLAGLVPGARQDDVVVVDLANTAYPVGINPLDMTRAYATIANDVPNWLNKYAAMIGAGPPAVIDAR